MYDTQKIANRIKKRTCDCGYTLKIMLTDLELGINLISHLSKGQVISSISLANIADYLDCSVDYLLGRTNNPFSHKIPLEGKLSVSPSNDIELKEAAYSFKTAPAPEDDDDTITSK